MGCNCGTPTCRRLSQETGIDVGTYDQNWPTPAVKRWGRIAKWMPV